MCNLTYKELWFSFCWESNTKPSNTNFFSLYQVLFWRLVVAGPEFVQRCDSNHHTTLTLFTHNSNTKYKARWVLIKWRWRTVTIQGIWWWLLAGHTSEDFTLKSIHWTPKEHIFIRHSSKFWKSREVNKTSWECIIWWGRQETKSTSKCQMTVCDISCKRNTGYHDGYRRCSGGLPT